MRSCVAINLVKKQFLCVIPFTRWHPFARHQSKRRVVMDPTNDCFSFQFALVKQAVLHLLAYNLSTICEAAAYDGTTQSPERHRIPLRCRRLNDLCELSLPGQYDLVNKLVHIYSLRIFDDAPGTVHTVKAHPQMDNIARSEVMAKSRLALRKGPALLHLERPPLSQSDSGRSSLNA
ncbi:uncharacterized protein LOC111249947 [Varroa destructor]|uniref:Uncharacterized protein n=1 Tax=Varroa destructor TaxID=109461 RepID=A0A7M7KF61_VARDE|nr:uncharacterized protein LOC111249947 [Varroa destructor]